MPLDAQIDAGQDAGPQPTVADLAPQIAKARAAGYSDAEITAHLAQTPEWGAKVGAALKAGYAPADLIGFLAKPPAAPETVADVAARYGTAPPPKGTTMPVWAAGAEVPNPPATRPVPEDEFPAGTVPMHPAEQQINHGALGRAALGALQAPVTGTGAMIAGIGAAARAGMEQAQPYMGGLFDRIDAGKPLPPQLPPATRAAVEEYRTGSPQVRSQIRGMYATAASDAGAGPGAMERAGAAVQRAGQAAFPLTQAEQSTRAARYGSVLGGLAPLAAITAATGGAGLGVSIFGQSYDGAFRDAKQRGMSDQHAGDYATAQAATQVGVLAVPVGRVLQAIPMSLRAAFASTLATIGRHGLEFASFNALSRFASNFVTRQTIDPKQPLMQDVGRAALEGAFAGMVVPMIGMAPHVAGSAARGVAEAAAPAASPEFRAGMNEVEQHARAVQAAQGVAASVDAAVGKRQAVGAPDGTPIAATPPAGPKPTEAAPAATPGVGKTGGDNQNPVATTPPAPSGLPTLDAVAAEARARNEAQPGETAPNRAEPGAIAPNPLEAMAALDQEAAKPAPPGSPMPTEAVANPVSPDPSSQKGAPSSQLAAPATELPAPAASPEPPAPESMSAANAPAEFSVVHAAPAPEEAAGTSTPTRIRNLDQIQREDDVGPRRAAAIQAEEIAAIGRPITDEEREARAAGVAAKGPSAPRAETAAPEEPAERAPSGAYVMLSPEDLRLDPDRFQYKSADAKGVTGALLGTNRWEPALANPITAWQAADGTMFVVNGHQRTDLAQRAQAAGQPDVQVPARVFQEADGYTPEFMRVLGAYQNMAEGSGTALDAAKVLRAQDALPESPRLRLPDLPPRSAMVQQAQGLARLDPRAFGMVESGAVAPAHAAFVGQMIHDPAEQVAALDVLARARPDTAEQARMMVQDVRDSGFLAGSQTTLFGEEALASSLFPERARVLAQAMSALRRARGVFKAAVQGDETLTGAGNTLNREGNVAGKTENERLIDRLAADATKRGPISDALSDAAREVAGGKTVTGAASRFLATVRALERRGEGAGIQHGAVSDRVEPAEEGDAGRVEDASQDAMFSRRDDDENKAATAPEVRTHLAQAMRRVMLLAGLPARVGLRLVDKLVDAAGGAADAAYTRGLITFALDTKPEDVPRKLFHEVIHGLLDLGVLSDGQRKALFLAADRYLAHGDNRAAIERLYGTDPALVREEAVARLAEAALETGRRPPPLIRRAADAMVRTVTGIGQALRGEGFTTADDVFRAIMHGRVRGEGNDAAAPEMWARRASLPPQSGAPLFGEAEREERPKVAPEPTIRTDQRQMAMPGMEAAAVQAQAARDQTGRGALQAKAEQRAADEGLFAAKPPAQGGLFSRREITEPDASALGRIVARLPPVMRGHVLAALDAARDFAKSIRDGLVPMAGGTVRAQRFAADFANALRQILYRYGAIDREIERRFTPAQREAMGRSMDAQSVFEQQARDMTPEEAAKARAEFDRSGQGLAGLPDHARHVLEALDAISQDVWRRMQERGMVKPDARALPFYFPRQIVMWSEETGAFHRPKGGAGGNVNGIDARGRNLTTAGPMHREHLTPEETEAAAKAKLGTGATLLRDIRSLLSRLAYAERAIAGSDLMRAIADVGRETGDNLVLHGDIPGLLNPDKFFRMSDHPAFRRWTGNGWQAIHVAEEFRHPLKAVLTQPSPTWYRAAMLLKGAVMSVKMYSPFLHLAVELGRSLPIMPARVLTLRALRDGSRLRRDLSYMDQATRDGLAPLAHRGGWATDPASLADQARDLEPSRSAFLRGLASVRDAAAAGARRLGGDTLHDIVQHPHQTLLWDQVFNLQVGIYDHMRQTYIAKGYAPEVAGTMAAHIANRYAGALPPEHLSRAANMAANLLMFSRSFTLGNAGVMKDMFNGAPAHVRARIEQMAGPAVARSAQVALRRKAIASFALDIGLFYIANGLTQLGLQAIRQGIGPTAQDWEKDAAEALSETADGNPLAIFGVLPQHWNEPGKQDRIYAGTDASGRGVYLRLPPGKVGEEFIGWMARPGVLLTSKLSPLVRPIIEDIMGHDDLGRPLFKPDPQTVSDCLDVAGAAVWHVLSDLGPTSTLQGLGEIGRHVFMGTPWKGDANTTMLKILGPASGLAQVSSGYPGGPAAAEMHAVSARQRYSLQEALPGIRDKVRAGDIEGAYADMRALGVSPSLQKFYVNSTLRTGPSRGAQRAFQRAATPQDKTRLSLTTGAQ